MSTAATAVAVFAALVSIVVAVVNGRSAIGAQKVQGETALKVAQADDDINAGQLALNYAKQLEPRLAALETFHEEIGPWWDRHRDRDGVVDAELRRLDPSFRVPPSEPLPRLRRVATP